MMYASGRSPWDLYARAVITALMCAVAVILSACQTTRTITKIEYQKIQVPESLLKCMPEPEAKAAWTTQRQVALYLVRLAEAGEDCRLKLAAVKRVMILRTELKKGLAIPKGLVQNCLPDEFARHASDHRIQ